MFRSDGASSSVAFRAAAPEGIVFGLNATSLMRFAAEAIRLKPATGDCVVVTELDHEADIGVSARDGHSYTPRLLRAAGFDPEEGVVRVSLCHHNAVEEIGQLEVALHWLRS